jgi:hypothetical protein
MDHGEIRFRLLYALYKSYYDGQIKQWQHIEDVIESEAKLGKASKNSIFGDAVYLADKHHVDINSDEEQGEDRQSQCIQARISAQGIDEIEQAINASVFARLEAQGPKYSDNAGSLYLRLNVDVVKGLIEPEVSALAKERQGRLHVRHAVRRAKSDPLSDF